jgi:3-phosphoshikimate 1-carboxyvinyltransferase
MGAVCSGHALPLTVTGARSLGEVAAIRHESPKSSAQVKSAILLAALAGKNESTVIEPYRSRDHTERMLSSMGATLIESFDDVGRWQVRVSPPSSGTLSPLDVQIPGDLSSAAFFVALATLVPGSRLTIRNVGTNPTRTGFLTLIERMGASVVRARSAVEGGETVSDLEVEAAELRGITVTAEDVASAIDEIPILAVCMAFARGPSTITGAEELRVKESDRISMMTALLRSRGAEVDEFSDGMRIAGGLEPGSASVGRGTNLPKHGDGAWEHALDHRIIMCRAVLDYVLKGEVRESGRTVIETSFPGFFDTLRRVSAATPAEGGAHEA